MKSSKVVDLQSLAKTVDVQSLAKTVDMQSLAKSYCSVKARRHGFFKILFYFKKGVIFSFWSFFDLGFGTIVDGATSRTVNPNSRREGCSSELNHSYGWHLHRSGDNGLETWWQFLFGSSQGLDKVFFIIHYQEMLEN